MDEFRTGPIEFCTYILFLVNILFPSRAREYLFLMNILYSTSRARAHVVLSLGQLVAY